MITFEGPFDATERDILRSLFDTAPENWTFEKDSHATYPYTAKLPHWKGDVSARTVHGIAVKARHALLHGSIPSWLDV